MHALISHEASCIVVDASLNLLPYQSISLEGSVETVNMHSAFACRPYTKYTRLKTLLNHLIISFSNDYRIMYLSNNICWSSPLRCVLQKRCTQRDHLWTFQGQGCEHKWNQIIWWQQLYVGSEYTTATTNTTDDDDDITIIHWIIIIIIIIILLLLLLLVVVVVVVVVV